MEMVWKTVPCSRSSMREAALSELGSAPRLGVDSCAGGSETRSTLINFGVLMQTVIEMRLLSPKFKTSKIGNGR